jgi:hypothetical protein
VNKLILLALLILGCAPGDSPYSHDTPEVESLLPPKPAVVPQVAGGLQQRVEAALGQIKRRDLLTTHSFWTVLHGILGVGPDAMLLDPETGKRTRALDYICNGGEVRGLRFLPTADGLDVQTGPVFVGQGHQDQFIAEMAQVGLKLDQKFVVLGKQYTFEDFVRHAQRRARVTTDQELSWSILIIAQHRGTGANWTNAFGEHLRFEDLVRYELNQSVENAACGGTHRLFGLTWTYYLHRQHGGKTEGVWKDVARKIERYKKLARKYQNPDGSFSTRYLAGPGAEKDLQSRIGTTGHVLEWLALALTDEELREGWVQDAANALSLMILEGVSQPIESGSLYHAAHGLHVYHQRVFSLEKVPHDGLLIPPPPRVH